MCGPPNSSIQGNMAPTITEAAGLRMSEHMAHTVTKTCLIPPRAGARRGTQIERAEPNSSNLMQDEATMDLHE